MALKFLGTVQAGFQSPAGDYKEDLINLTEQLELKNEAVFVVRVTGESMIEAHIPPGAWVVVDKRIRPRHNAIVVASVDGDQTIKYMVSGEFGCKLIPANKKMKELIITEDMHFVVFGVVTHVVFDLKHMIL